MEDILREMEEEKKKDTYDQKQRVDVLGTQNTEKGASRISSTHDILEAREVDGNIK